MPDPQDDRLHHLRAYEPPFAKLLGVEIVEATDEAVVATMPVGEAMRNRNGVMHGGAVMAFADCLGGTAATFHLPPGRSSATIESKTNFLRAVRLGDTVRGVCRVRHRGRTTMVLETEIFASDGRLAALVVQTQIVLDARPALRS